MRAQRDKGRASAPRQKEGREKLGRGQDGGGETEGYRSLSNSSGQEGTDREEGRRVAMSREHLITGKGRLGSGGPTVLASREGGWLVG